MTPIQRFELSLAILQVLAFLFGMIFAFNIMKRKEKDDEKA
jgi:hypothetical protein